MATATLTQSKAWQKLQQHFDDIKTQQMCDWFAADPERFQRFHISAAGLNLDFSKNRITSDTLTLLASLAEERQLADKIQAMFAGELVNQSEKRPALHTALRNLAAARLLRMVKM